MFYPIQVLLQSKVWARGSDHMQKPNILLGYLKQASTIPDDQLVVFVDSWDVIAARPYAYREVEAVFDRLTDGNSNGLVFNGECNCWPGRDICETMRGRGTQAGIANGHFPYLNSGAFVARKATMTRFLESLLAYVASEQGKWEVGEYNDQAAFQSICYSDNPAVVAHRKDLVCAVDADSSFFMAVFPTVGGLSLARPCLKGLSKLANLTTGPSRWSNLIDPSVLVPCRSDQVTGRSCIKSKFSDGQPALVHFNGGGSDADGDGSGEIIEAFLTAQIKGFGLSVTEVAERVAGPAISTFLWVPESVGGTFSPVDPEDADFSSHCAAFTKRNVTGTTRAS